MADGSETAAIYIPDKHINNSFQAYPFETSEKDPVIFENLEDITLYDDGSSEKISVEFQSRSESKGDVLIVWEHDGDIIKAKKVKVTHGVTSCKLEHDEDVEGIWTVHVVDVHFGRAVKSSCEVTLEE